MVVCIACRAFPADFPADAVLAANTILMPCVDIRMIPHTQARINALSSHVLCNVNGSAVELYQHTQCLPITDEIIDASPELLPRRNGSIANMAHRDLLDIRLNHM